MQRLVSWQPANGPKLHRRSAALLLSGLVLTLSPNATLAAQSHSFATQPEHGAIDAHVAEAAQRFGIPAAWIRAVMRVESGNRSHAVSPKGAMGLMQIMPATWEGLRLRHALGRDPFDPHDNILAGAAYLRELYDRYGSPGFLAAYNAGPGRYEASRAGRSLPAETVAYVNAIAPALGGHAAVETPRAAPVDLLAWVRASLFPARSERRSSDDPVPTRMEKASITPAVAARDVSGIAPQSGGLFVARSPRGDVR
ncbi:lytic transglycosylase [Aureimonas ureilytica]|uniref:Lytic transglycosylase n=1 Tax=Aureimonas ureilytica TaxID=401562 RepID=A0A175R9V3_9HYPH|nr:lytic transglycosylase domain-containing protein [Aureimonas ureilytica]KTQ96345.1 lytic transglycosylase [Aureimonas ureilytica]